MPGPALVLIYRLLFFALEATLAFAFWATKAKKGDYGMVHLCSWGRDTLEYDGLCSHVALNEGIPGDFDMSPEELEANAAKKEKKRVLLNNQNNSNWHFKKMIVDHDG